jgi:hypothetical protein
LPFIRENKDLPVPFSLALSLSLALPGNVYGVVNVYVYVQVNEYGNGMGYVSSRMREPVTRYAIRVTRDVSKAALP